MNPRQLKTFLAVIRHENLTRAAAEVNLAQSTLSDQIQALEEELGAELFLRSRQGVVPTAAGAVLKAYAEQILVLNEEAKAAVSAAAGNAEQSITLGTLETIAAERLAPWLSLFRKKNPTSTSRSGSTAAASCRHNCSKARSISPSPSIAGSRMSAS